MKKFSFQFLPLLLLLLAALVLASPRRGWISLEFQRWDWSKFNFYLWMLFAVMLGVGLHWVVGFSRKRPRSLAIFASESPLREASYPAPFPNGWYKLLDSSDLKNGELKYVECLGQQLVVFRGEDGKAHALDAHCPHMGANLAFGGRVVGNCVECPFHLWTFKGEDGQCASIPYSSTPPQAAKTKSWPISEKYNMICIFFDAEGRKDPLYELPDIEGITDNTMVKHGTYYQDIKMHIQEFAENSADYQHFQPLHGQMCIPFTELTIPGVTIQHSASWHILEDSPHIALFKDHAVLKIFGKLWDFTSADATITFLGPGGIVYFLFEIPKVGRIILFQTHTPLKPLLQRTEFSWYAEKQVPKLLAWWCVGNWIAQWKRDIMVWENKIFSRKPVLVKGDGPIMQLRRWYKQFYSEHSEEVWKNSCDARKHADW